MNVLRNFLVRYQPFGDEYDKMFRSFLREIEDKQAIRLTFDQQKAYDDRSVLYLNIYHPIICACLNYFIQKEDKSKTSFSYAIRNDEAIPAGSVYYLAVYKLSTSRMIQGIRKSTDTLFPVVFDDDICLIIQCICIAIAILFPLKRVMCSLLKPELYTQ